MSGELTIAFPKTKDQLPIATDSQITLFKNCPKKVICEISSNLKNLRDGLKAVNVF